MEENNKTELCNWCGQVASVIYVHGHGQCSVCGINVDECCKGETCNVTYHKNIYDEQMQVTDEKH